MIIRTVTAAALTSGGPSQTIAAGSGPGSTLTPKAAIYELTGSVTLDASVTHRRYGLGFTDGTTQRALGVMAESGQIGLNADAGLRADTASVINFPLTTSEAVDAVAAWTSWQSGGSEITWSDFPATAVQIKATYFFGDDVQAKVVEFHYDAAGSNEQTCSGAGFEPNFAFVMTRGSSTTAWPSAGTEANLNFSKGYAVSRRRFAGEVTPVLVSTVDQICFSDFVKDRMGSTSGTTFLGDESVACPMDDIGGIGSTHPIGLNSFTGDGATFEDPAGAGRDFYLQILFLRFGGDIQMHAALVPVADSGELQLLTHTTGFANRAQAYFAIGTGMSSINGTGDFTSPEPGKHSHGVYTGTENVFVSGTANDAVGTSSTQSRTGDDVVFYVIDIGVGAYFQGTHVSLDDDGITLDFAGSALDLGTDRYLGYVVLGSPRLTLAETEQISENVVLRVASFLPLSETENITDQATLILNHKRSLSETENISDQALLILNRTLSLSETEQISDQALLFIGNKIVLSETEQIGDQAILVTDVQAATVLNETEQISETVFFRQNFLIVTDETEQISENTATRTGIAIFDVSETERISENVLLITGRVISTSETENILDDFSFGAGLRATKSWPRGTVYG